MIEQLIDDLRQLGNATKAAQAQRFFKTGPGEYGEGDQFIGVTVPEVRSVLKKYFDCPLQEIKQLLKSEFHECRLAALLLLVHQYQKGTESTQKQIVDAYLKSTKYINNWDLVDTSAYHIVGPWLFEHNETSLLISLADSKSLWEQRIAIIATLHYIRKDDFAPTLHIAERLLHHPHDLMHKAVGWMLREVGNRDEAVLVQFLSKHYKTMPRTMLRYAIEKFDGPRRKKYLAGIV